MSDIKIDKIIRSKRRTIALEVAQDASLIIRAPEMTKLEIIQKLITKKADWIRRKQEYARTTYAKATPKEFVNGEGFLFIGENYKLHIANNQDDPLIFSKAFYLSKSVLPDARNIFLRWYRRQAYEIISERVDWYAMKSGLKYNAVKITDARKRWGSCSRKGNLNFSWRLVMAPIRVIDYVVAHELAHLRYKSHSKDFWNAVGIMVPGYEAAIKWLQVNSNSLIL